MGFELHADRKREEGGFAGSAERAKRMSEGMVVDDSSNSPEQPAVCR